MKYVYVLTSCEKDTYYEQFFLSLTSLRLYNPEADIIVLIDNKTKSELSGIRSGYEKLISEIKIINVPCEYSQKESSRWIKTSLHHYISGDFIFIDCDTIITEKLEYNFPPEIKIGAILDTHVTLENHHLRINFQKEDIKAGFSSSLKINKRYNGGIILYQDDTQSSIFFEKWHSLWIEGAKSGCSQDMPSLNQANFLMNDFISELDGIWNCQISHNGLPYLNKAKIIHYYATSLVSFEPAYFLASSGILSSIKTSGTISDNIMTLIENPKSAFSKYSRIITDNIALDIIDSAYFSKLLWLRRNHNKTFFLFNDFISGIKNPWKINQNKKKY